MKPAVLPQYNVAKDLKDVKMKGELFKEYTFCLFIMRGVFFFQRTDNSFVSGCIRSQVQNRRE